MWELLASKGLWSKGLWRKRAAHWWVDCGGREPPIGGVWWKSAPYWWTAKEESCSLVVCGERAPMVDCGGGEPPIGKELPHW